MGISFDKALGIHEQALNFRVKRAEILANNLANSDTPGFKARDMDFKSFFNRQMEDGLKVSQTHGQHLSGDMESSQGLMYRNATQPSIDGNTVDTNVELANYARNAMDYETTFQFLNAKFKGLTTAIKGE